MWDLPGPGFKPVSPAVAGGFLTTAPPGKSKIQYSNSTSFLYSRISCCCSYLIKSACLESPTCLANSLPTVPSFIILHPSELNFLLPEVDVKLFFSENLLSINTFFLLAN